MIADRATSLDIPELRECCVTRGDIGASADRSVIVRWLRTNYQDPLEFLTTIGDQGFSPQSGVAGVYPKEREGKNDPRLFGLMTLERRLYIVITEALIADFILPYFPEITMTFNQPTLLTRLHHASRSLDPTLQSISKHVSIVTNIDFEKWNSNMREEETLTIFQDFDRLFGLTGVFSRSHELFQGCQFYLADGSITPQWESEARMAEGPGVWSHHLGGIEGLRQKGWTIFTVVVLKYICEINHISFQLMGQGDNQVLITRYYPSPQKTIRTQHLNFLRSLDQFLMRIGPPIKLEESWSSSNFFTYGKFPIEGGVPLSMSLKRLSRCGRLNNEGMVNLDSVLSSISANVSAAVSLSSNPLVPLLPALLESLAAIRLHVQSPFYGPSLLHRLKKLIIRMTSEKRRQTKVAERLTEFTTKLLRDPSKICLIIAWIPSSLGGYPILQVSDLLMHGFPDPVSAAIWELKKSWQVLPDSQIASKRAISAILTPRFSAYRNPELLCQDPTSLNLVRGSRPQDQKRRMVFNYLPNLPGINNQAFISFFAKAKEKQDDLALVLFSMNPCHPRIMASIYDSTPIGRAHAIIRKVERTRTLEKMMVKHKDNEIRIAQNQAHEDNHETYKLIPKEMVDLNYVFEANQFHSILYIINQPHPEQANLQTCSGVLAHQWRVRSWGKDLKGVTVAVPMELIEEYKDSTCENHPSQDLGYIRSQNDISPTGGLAFFRVGPFKPFFGSKTSEKVKYEGGKLARIAPPVLSTAIKNLRLINWGTLDGSNLSQLITTIFGTMTDAPWRPFIPRLGGPTGTTEHRWDDVRTDHSTTPSMSYQVSTHYSINTNKFKPEMIFDNIEIDNVNISMQSLFSYISSCNVLTCLYSIDIPKTSHWHIRCRECIRAVDENFIDIPDGDEFKDLVVHYQHQEFNEYLWTPKEKLLSKIQVKEVTRSCTIQEYQGNLEYLLSIAVTDWLIQENPIHTGTTPDWTLEPSTKMIPMSIVLKLNANDILEWVCSILLLQCLYRRSKFWLEKIPHETMLYTIQSETRRLTNLPVNWFYPLASLFMADSMYQMLAEKFPQISPPKNCPASEPEKAYCVKTVCNEIWYNHCSELQLIRKISQILKQGLIQSNQLIWHPEILICLRKWLSDPHHPSAYLRILSEIRHKELELGSSKPDNCISLTSLLMLPEDLLMPLGLITIGGKSTTIVDTSPDAIAKLLGRRPKPSDMPETRGRTVPFIREDIADLPQAVTYFYYTPACQSESSTYVGIAPLEHTVSSINQLYKQPHFVTTAAYKLISVVNQLIRLRQMPSKAKLIISCGDGTGGFSACLKKLYPEAKIIYNSLFMVSSQSSIGYDRFIPAALARHDVSVEDIEGVHEVVEGLSDLTDPDIVHVLNRERRQVDLIVCDAEGCGKQDPSKLLMITYNLLGLAHLSGTFGIILKSYMSRVDLVICQMHLLYTAFENVNCHRSHFSGYGNTEVYLSAFTPRQVPRTCEAELLETGDGMVIEGWAPDPEDVDHIRSSLISFNFNKIAKDVYPMYNTVLGKTGGETFSGISVVSTS